MRVACGCLPKLYACDCAILLLDIRSEVDVRVNSLVGHLAHGRAAGKACLLHPDAATCCGQSTGGVRSLVDLGRGEVTRDGGLLSPFAS